MHLEGPDRYLLQFTPNQFTCTCPKGTPRFSGLATKLLHKLYVISIENVPIYVGITSQSMRNRLRYGFSADGSSGYHGYAWRNHHTQATLDIWCLADPEKTKKDLETIEAEVVFLIRQSGQWPASQTEIHFHPSTEEHREAARSILGCYMTPIIRPTSDRDKGKIAYKSLDWP